VASSFVAGRQKSIGPGLAVMTAGDPIKRDKKILTAGHLPFGCREIQSAAGLLPFGCREIQLFWLSGDRLVM
jgi:hypothetical protein